ncbi:transglycosylase domain-containing protein [Rhodococcus sp. CSLK01-03]|uniref:Transglycosylase domain-containing protein n=1 Tax=Rhodococcus indonesiensis TaxID=3055869 RepID=A0ABT7RQM1_9NOCA|nr:transglycosylase domain-containing protein [Rhodococcus indonesiensis]
MRPGRCTTCGRIVGPFERRVDGRCTRCVAARLRAWAATPEEPVRREPQGRGPKPRRLWRSAVQWPRRSEPQPRRSEPQPRREPEYAGFRRPEPPWPPVARPGQPPLPAQPPRNPWPARAKWAGAAVAALVLIALTATASLRVWTPASSRFMRIDDGPVTYQYVSLDHVSRYVVASVIAHEDDQMGLRAQAFHWGDYADRAVAHLTGEPQQTYSTIPQQLAKNMFFTPDQSAIRKAVETVPSILLSTTLPDARIMELYLNYAQFGPDLYGVCAASWYYFDTAPWEMYQYHAMQLAGMLPNPEDVVRLPGGGVATPPDAPYPSAAFHINGAANVDLPARFAGWGGWENIVASVGIEDSAADHADDRPSADSCSTMPEPVRQRLAVEDPGFVSRSQ